MNNKKKRKPENAITNDRRIWSYEIFFCFFLFSLFFRSLLAVELTRGMCGARNINRISCSCVNSVLRIIILPVCLLNVFLFSTCFFFNIFPSYSFRTIVHFCYLFSSLVLNNITSQNAYSQEYNI